MDPLLLLVLVTSMSELSLITRQHLLDFGPLPLKLRLHLRMPRPQLAQRGLLLERSRQRLDLCPVLLEVGEVGLVRGLELDDEVKSPLSPSALDEQVRVDLEVLELGLDHALLLVLGFEVLAEEERVGLGRVVVEHLDGLLALDGRLLEVTASLCKRKETKRRVR